VGVVSHQRCQNVMQKNMTGGHFQSLLAECRCVVIEIVELLHCNSFETLFFALITVQ
jgi:hypothetical protein